MEESLGGSAFPKKIQGFLWKLLHGILQSRVSLASRGIPLDVSCFRCNMAVESGLHATRFCLISDVVRRMLNFSWDHDNVSIEDYAWLIDKVVNIDPTGLQQLGFSLWYLLFIRNKELHGEGRSAPQ